MGIVWGALIMPSFDYLDNLIASLSSDSAFTSWWVVFVRQHGIEDVTDDDITLVRQIRLSILEQISNRINTDIEARFQKSVTEGRKKKVPSARSLRDSEGLTEHQRMLLELLVTAPLGVSASELAESVGVTKQTVDNWLKTPTFQVALKKRQEQLYLADAVGIAKVIVQNALNGDLGFVKLYQQVSGNLIERHEHVHTTNWQMTQINLDNLPIEGYYRILEVLEEYKDYIPPGDQKRLTGETEAAGEEEWAMENDGVMLLEEDA